MSIDAKRLVQQGYDAVSYAYRGREVDEGLDQRYKAWLEPLDQILPNGGNVLDLGCGCGLPATRLLATRYQVTGVDISPIQIERARALVPQAAFHCADFTSFLFTPNYYDAIVSFYSIIHVPLAEQPALIGNVARALRPGGVLLMTVGREAWTGTEANWLGVCGATIVLES